ncbi:MAG: glycosyltransferase [Rhodobacteraceae bacterium]|nr:glycosyltransferase [Paracoccaceae bacterium]
MADIDVVIVNYHSAAHAYNCVRSVHDVAEADGVDARIYVVNNSDDATELRDAVGRAGGATIIENGRNLGFGAACNIGARQGDAGVILFLNPDAALLPGCLKTCLARLRDPDHANIGIAGPQLQDPNGALIPSCSRLPTCVDLLWRTAGLHALFPQFEYPYLSRAAHRRSGPVGQVMGAALFIGRDLFQRLNGFDEAFFLYYEDVDVCARAAALGKVCWYECDAHASHLGGGSSSHDSSLAMALHIASRLTYARRHFGVLAHAAVLVVALLIELPLRIVKTLVNGGSVRAVIATFGKIAGFGVLGTPVDVPDAKPRAVS